MWDYWFSNFTAPYRDLPSLDPMETIFSKDDPLEVRPALISLLQLVCLALLYRLTNHKTSIRLGYKQLPALPPTAAPAANPLRYNADVAHC